MKIMFFLLIFISLNCYSYDACTKNKSVTCNDKAIKTIEDDLKISFSGNYDIVLDEMIKLKLKQKYDDYINLYIKPERQKIETCKTELKTTNCLKLADKYLEGLESMRISLALFNPPGRVHEFNFKNDDMFKTNIDHFTFVEAEKPKPLSIHEKKRAKLYFMHLYNGYIKDNDIETKPKEFVDVLKLNDATKEVRSIAMNTSRELYLDSILRMPVLKFLKAPIDELNFGEVLVAYEKLEKDINLKSKALGKISKEDFKQLYLFDGLMNEVLSENSFLCQSAKVKKKNILNQRESLKTKLTWGGLGFCLFGLGSTCAGAVFAGNTINLIDSKNRLDTSLKFSLDESTLSKEQINESTKEVGSDAMMVLLSTPISIAGKIGMKKIGVDSFFKNGIIPVGKDVKNYLKAVKEDGIKRAFLKTPLVVYQYSYKTGKGIFATKINDSRDVYKYAFKKLKDKPGLLDQLDYVVQAPILGISKLLTKKSYTFQPAETSVKLFEKRFLKNGQEFAGPLSNVGNLIDFRIFLTGYGYLLNKSQSLLGGDSIREDYAKNNFHRYEIDSRFQKLRQLEQHCKNSKICSKDLDQLIRLHSTFILEGSMKLKAKLLSLSKLGVKEADVPKEILNDPDVMSYSSGILPYFYERFPDYKTGNPMSDIQKKTFELDFLKLQIASFLKTEDIEKIINESRDIPVYFAKFLTSSPNAINVITSQKGEKMYKALGEELNSWIRVNQEALISPSS